LRENKREIFENQEDVVGGEKVLRERERERDCLRTKGSWKHRRTRDGERNREKGLKEKYRGVNCGDILRTRK
jgi:hypothetical protein